jgi:hypothetical protein
VAILSSKSYKFQRRARADIGWMERVKALQVRRPSRPRGYRLDANAVYQWFGNSVAPARISVG